MAQAITILDFAVGRVYTYEVSKQALKHNDAEELVEFFGHEINMVELPF